MTQEEVIQRARQAETLLEDPLLKQALGAIEAHYIDVWKASRPSEYELREECHAGVYALVQLRGQLQNYFETGKIRLAASSDT